MKWILFQKNVSLALFVSFTPLLVTALIKHGIILAPGLLLIFVVMMVLIALFFSRKYSKY